MLCYCFVVSLNECFCWSIHYYILHNGYSKKLDCLTFKNISVAYRNSCLKRNFFNRSKAKKQRFLEYKSREFSFSLPLCLWKTNKKQSSIQMTKYVLLYSYGCLFQTFSKYFFKWSYFDTCICTMAVLNDASLFT